LKFKNISRWKAAPELDGLLFLAQRLDELLWDFTLDTHKPMSLNAPFLCSEALDVIANIEDELIEPANLKPILEELIWSVRNDPVAKSLLDLPIERYVDPTDDSKLSDRKGRLGALANTLGPFRYLHACFDQLSASVKQVEKKKIDVISRAMVTTLLNMGVSKRSLFARSNAFFFAHVGPAIDSPNQVDEFLKSLYPYAHECTVYFVVSDLVKTVAESLGAFNIKILEKLPDDIAALQAETPEFALGDGECYVGVGPVRALDVYSAQENAAQALDRLSDLFTLFYHQRKITWRDTALVNQCCLDSPVAATLTSGAMAKPFDLRPDKASKELNRLIRNFAIRGGSRDRFNRVADLHGICVSTDVVENQLVTLWTSLETLIPSRTGGSKITNVLDGMIPFLMHGYVRRLIQRFTHDLITWRPWRAKRILNKVPGIVEPHTMLRALALLAVKDNGPLRAELYAELKDFHLLRFRAFQLAEMLATPRSLKDALAVHEAKVRWQIRRIYRTRNLLVHSGKRPSYIHTLVENAHDYLDQIVFEVMKLSCGEYRAATLEQVFELASVRYARFMSELSSLKAFEPHNCGFLCKDMDALSDFVNEAWGYESEADAQLSTKPPAQGNAAISAVVPIK
jgi:hypothetical protein